LLKNDADNILFVGIEGGPEMKKVIWLFVISIPIIPIEIGILINFESMEHFTYTLLGSSGPSTETPSGMVRKSYSDKMGRTKKDHTCLLIGTKKSQRKRD